MRSLLPPLLCTLLARARCATLDLAGDDSRILMGSATLEARCSGADTPKISYIYPSLAEFGPVRGHNLTAFGGAIAVALLDVATTCNNVPLSRPCAFPKTEAQRTSKTQFCGPTLGSTGCTRSSAVGSFWHELRQDGRVRPNRTKCVWTRSDDTSITATTHALVYRQEERAGPTTSTTTRAQYGSSYQDPTTYNNVYTQMNDHD